MNKKLITIAIVITVMGGILLVGKMNNTGVSTTNPLSTYNDLGALRKSTNIQFNIPEMLTHEKDLSYKNLYGQMVEISNTDTVFKAARFVNNKADVGGNYDKYKIDKEYDVSGNTSIKYLRIRTNSEDITSMKEAIINYNTGDMAYSLKLDKNSSYSSILSMLGLTEKDLKVKSDVKKNSIEKGDTSDTYNMDSLKCKISLPKMLSDVKEVEGVSGYKYVTFMVASKAVFSIEEYNTTEYDKNTVVAVQLDSKHIIKYYKSNPFSKDTVEYGSYENIVKSMDFIVKSFKTIDK